MLADDLNHRTFPLASLLKSLAFALCVSAPAMGEDLAAYAWRARISGDPATGILHRALLPAAFAEKLQAFPLDIRIADEAGVFWPALIWADEQPAAVDPVSSRNISTTIVDRPASYHSHLFKIEDDAGTPPLHNRVIISLGGSEFTRKVEVWKGSSDSNVQLHAQGFVVERSSPVAFRQRTINYGDIQDPVVEIRIFDDPERIGAPVSVRAIEFASVDRQSSRHIGLDAQMLDVPADNKNIDDTVSFYVDTGIAALPLHHLDVELDAEPGVYPAKVYGRADPGQGWRWIADGGVITSTEGGQGRIELPRPSVRYLKIELYHAGKNIPHARRIRAGFVPHFLVFMPTSTGKAFLYGGSPSYQLPGSWFARMVNRNAVLSAPELTLEALKDNPKRWVGSVYDYKKMLMWLGVVVVGMMLVLGALRKIRSRFI